MKRNGMTLRCVWASTLLAGLCWALAGCADGINPPSPEQLAAFEQAGPGGPVLDLDRVAHARLQTGPYRLVPGDVLQIDMPARLDPDALTTPAGPGGKATHVCRVSDSGMITLPDGREVAAKGRSLGEVESAIVGVYYPSLVKTKPAVYAHVLEYATANIRVMGGVTKPGIYHVRHDQMSLLAVLMEAGEIVEGGAATIRIVRSGPAKDESRVSLSGTMSLPTGDGAGPLPRVTLSSWPESEIPGSRSGELSVRFKKDGPLRTTGVLTIESGDATVVHQWLDIGSAYQRRAVLLAADRDGRTLPTDELDGRLARLAQSMDSDAAFGQTDWTTAPEASGSSVSAGVFVSYVGGTADDPVRDDRSPAAFKKLVYEAPESSRVAGDNETTLTLPVRGLNIPFADVPLNDGDTVIVERIKPQTISVIGLVARPGSFPYPPGAQYTLAETLALAGGLDPVADPRFVSVYRLRNDGTIIGVTFQFVGDCNQELLTQALALKVKPGDVVSVEHTQRTRMNVFFDRIVRINLGWYVQPNDFRK